MRLAESRSFGWLTRRSGGLSPDRRPVPLAHFPFFIWRGCETRRSVPLDLNSLLTIFLATLCGALSSGGWP